MKGCYAVVRSGLLTAVSATALIPVAAFAQQSSITQDTNVAAPTAQAASPSQAAGDVAGEAAAPTPPSDTAATPAGGDIVITGIRAAQQRAINIKRNAASVVDAISAQDIGKLPDVTISDSLQRIPGVQIRRDAGEGSTINIRGLPQVTTLMNGEEFLGANSITNVQPNFNDIPSQLFSGADVIKSATADLLDAGITGTVNLRTRRPFDLKSGITAALTAEGDYGDKVKHKFDPNVNGLISWHNDTFGALLSAAYSDVRLSNSHNGIQEGYGAALHNEGTADVTSSGGFSPPNRPHGTVLAGGRDVNGDGDVNDSFIVPQGFTAWDRINQRQRLGINGSFQWKISDGLSFNADGFFTRQREYDRTAGIQMQDVNWQAAEFTPGQSRDTGAIVNGYHVNTTQIYNYDLGNFDSYSQLDRYKSMSQNYNAELKWDNGGPFKATVRGIYGKATQDYDQSYTQFSLSNGQQWQPGGIGHYPASLGGNRVFNSAGYSVNTIAGASSLPATVNFTGSQPTFTLPSQVLSEIGNIQDYALKTISSEGNYRRKGELKLVRADATYEATPNLTFEFGARYSDRSVTNSAFDRAAPLYAGNGASNPAGCLVKWKAFDVPMNDASCSAGDAAGYFTAGLTRKADDPSFNGQVKQYTLPGKGIPALYVLDPHAMDNVLGFQNSFYPGNVEVANPGASYAVGVKQTSGYVQMNFSGEGLGMQITGNGGLKIIHTALDITQFVTGSPQPYGLANLPNGTVETNRGFTDFLPSVNIAFGLTDNVKLRFAFSRTMTLLNLDQWGGGLTPNYAIDTSNPGSPVFRVTGGSSTGNPALDPWRATNFDTSFEWYVGRASLLSLGAFYINVDSFIQSGSILRSDLPDNDGVVRNRTVSISTPVQGAGGNLKGIEAAAKISFSDLSFMPSLLSGFGIDSNFTLSPSHTKQRDLAGRIIPFQDNSKYQINAALFYESHGLSARVAWNYRSKRAAQSDFGGITGLELYQAPTNYIDANVSYDINPHMTVYVQGSNLTGEYERYYLVWKDERAYNNIYERRYAAGLRVKF